jgi:hypothetical protein
MNLEKKGKFNNLESVTKEIKLMMDPNADPYATPTEGEAKFLRNSVQKISLI